MAMFRGGIEGEVVVVAAGERRLLGSLWDLGLIWADLG